MYYTIDPGKRQRVNMYMPPNHKEFWEKLNEIVERDCPNASPQVRAQYARGLFGSWLARLAATDWMIRHELEQRLDRSRSKTRKR